MSHFTLKQLKTWWHTEQVLAYERLQCWGLFSLFHTSFFPKNPKSCKSWLDEYVKEPKKAFWETKSNLRGTYLWHYVFTSNCCADIPQNTGAGIINWCFIGWDQLPETHVWVNVIMRLIGPPRGCPLKAMRFPLKTFQGCNPKAIPPTHQPHRSRTCDLWLGSPSANYCV